MNVVVVASTQEVITRKSYVLHRHVSFAIDLRREDKSVIPKRIRSMQKHSPSARLGGEA